jgi:hypothetical protein
LRKQSLFVVVAMLSAVPVRGQGGIIAAPSTQPAAGVIGSSSPASPKPRSGEGGPAPARGRSTRPAPSTARPPFAGIFPAREATPRASRGLRPLWFGLVTFDRSWLWTPTVVGGAIDDQRAPTLEQGLSGGLQLDIEPRRALVYVDGWYVGVVDQFSGYYRHLDLDAGLHTIEILATDYEPLAFDIAIAPGKTTTYRGSLPRAERRN